jgi:competence protein ComEC
VLKVGHHGSATSTGAALLRKARPRLALISVGPNDPFGHPSPDVLERLAAHSVRTLRTDREGSVSVITDGARIWVASHENGVAKTR